MTDSREEPEDAPPGIEKKRKRSDCEKIDNSGRDKRDDGSAPKGAG